MTRHPRLIIIVLLALVVSCISGTTLGFVAHALVSFDFSMQQAALPNRPTSTPLAVRTGATELESQIETVFQRAGSSVVNITSRSFELDFFLRSVPREGSGSGFFYDSQGHIVTNYHVIENAEEVQVTLSNGNSLPARIVGTDPSNDLAVLQVDALPADIVVATVHEAAELRVGQFVIAIGNPFGLEGTLTVGVVSSLGRVIDSPDERFIGEVIQTDAAINPGNSGGPLLNLAGEVVGVNSAILSPSGASAGIGFAIPARTVQRVVPALIETGEYPHPSLNAQLVELTPNIIRLLTRVGVDVPVDAGLLILETIPNGAAEQAGLQGSTDLVRVGGLLVPVGGDIITAVNTEPITNLRELIVYLETQTEVGQEVQVTIIRDGREQTIPVILGELVR